MARGLGTPVDARMSGEDLADAATDADGDVLDRSDVALAVALGLIKLGASAAVLVWAGFRQISDDDYARTVIAETFAHAPRLDPSGTSWLPFPFWWTGAAMLAFGRTLAVARGAALAASALAAGTFFLSLRVAGLRKPWAAAAALVASLGAWNLWMGAATVPEGFSGGLVACAIVLSTVRPFAWPAAVALAVAALSRYEAWPACATFAGIAALRVLEARAAVRGASAATAAKRGSSLHVADAALAIGVAIAAPMAWMLWNKVSHGSATHFLDRVTRYRQTVGAAGAPLGEKLLVYPSAMLRAFPEAVALGVLGLWSAWTWPRRMAPVLFAVGGTLAFLIVGELGEGAPTHHPERALVAVSWLAIALGAFTIQRFSFDPRPQVAHASTVGSGMLLAALLGASAWRAFSADEMPGSGDADRSVQIARGSELRGQGAAPLTVIPCAYEHFALIAAFGAPERVTISSSGAEAPNATPAPTARDACPRVVVRR